MVPDQPTLASLIRATVQPAKTQTNEKARDMRLRISEGSCRFLFSIDAFPSRKRFQARFEHVFLRLLSHCLLKEEGGLTFG